MIDGQPPNFLNMKIVKLLFLLIFFSLSQVAASAGLLNLYGKVVDVDTNKPIADVFVIADWEVCAGIVHCNHFCDHMEITKSDANGKYSVPMWLRGVIGWDAYKNGYEVSRYWENIIYMKKIDNLNKDERLSYLSRFGSRCGSVTFSGDRYLAPLNMALYNEASGIAITDKDKKIVFSMIEEIEISEFGRKEHADRHKKRNPPRRRIWMPSETTKIIDGSPTKINKKVTTSIRVY